MIWHLPNGDSDLANVIWHLPNDDSEIEHWIWHLPKIDSETGNMIWHLPKANSETGIALWHFHFSNTITFTVPKSTEKAMLNLIRLVDDIFATRKLTDANLRAFTENALLRMAQKNPGGIYTTIIADTTARYTAYYGNISNEMTKDAISQGLTITTRDARTACYNKIVALQGFVIFKFGDASDVYHEFFPRTLREYEKAQVDNLGPLLVRFMAAATTHLAAGYPAEVQAMQDACDAFTEARRAQKNVFADVKVLATGRRKTRAALTHQLTIDYLTIATHNIGNPDAFDDYFDPRYLPQHKTETINRTLKPGATLHAFRSIGPETNYVLNITSGSLLLGYGPRRKAPVTPATGTLYNEGSNQPVNAGALGFSTTHRYLNITNHTDKPVKVRIGRK